MIDFVDAFERGQKIVSELADIYKGDPVHFPEGIRLLLENVHIDGETPEENQLRIASLISAFYFAHVLVEKSGIRKE